MSKTLGTVIAEVQRRLGDTEERVWDGDEIKRYVIDGYNQLALQTHLFWERGTLEDEPYTGNYTASFEASYADTPFEQFQFTDSWEVDEDLSGLTAANHTATWERDYLTTEYVNPISTLPDDLYQIDRAVWNNKRLTPMTARELETDPEYETATGDLVAYSIEMVGLHKFRKYKIPTTTTAGYTVTGDYGILRDCSDLTSDTAEGTWGIPRRIGNEYVTGNAWGLPRRATGATDTTRIEYWRRGRTVSALSDQFETADHQTIYVRHYAMWKALEREGPGQDLKLSAHFAQRFAVGIARIRRRIQSVKADRIGRMGGVKDMRFQKPPRPRLPWAYGRVVR